MFGTRHLVCQAETAQPGRLKYRSVHEENTNCPSCPHLLLLPSWVSSLSFHRFLSFRTEFSQNVQTRCESSPKNPLFSGISLHSFFSDSSPPPNLRSLRMSTFPNYHIYSISDADSFTILLSTSITSLSDFRPTSRLISQRYLVFSSSLCVACFLYQSILDY